ncbi:uncharacterized protein [Mytilus edulis]|uniref:Uncharacterized protein n=1 Tax=Mytilus edulis TaxID=6550 RepID=A0A8S3S176_MYTED|nr:unnamed protein product [Mytilus edulis]
MSFSRRTSVRVFNCVRKLTNGGCCCRGSNARYIHHSATLLAEEKIIEEPIKFSTSKAANVTPSFIKEGNEDPPPAAQPLIVAVSLAAFLIYFGILREENDLDEQMGMTLYERVEGLEEQHLENYIEHCNKKKLPSEKYVKRLEMLHKEKEARKQKNNASGQD